MKLDEVERLIRDQQYTLSDRDLSKHLNCLEKNTSNANLINEQHTHHHSQYAGSNLHPKSLISSMLFTPTLRRSTSSAGASVHEAPHRNGCGGGKTVNWSDGIGATDQQIMFKETITKNFQDNLSNLEKSKIQTQNVIDNLRTSLSEIEIFTANNIFKLTSMTHRE